MSSSDARKRHRSPILWPGTVPALANFCSVLGWMPSNAAARWVSRSGSNRASSRVGVSSACARVIVWEFVVTASCKWGLLQLLEQFVADTREPAFFDEVELRRCPDRFVESQLPLAHAPNILTECVGGSLGDANRRQDLLAVFQIDLHLIERLAVTRYRAEVFVDPDNQTLLGCGFSQSLEPQKRVVQHLTTADRDMHVDATARPSEDRNDVRFDDVGPEGQESRRTAVHDEHSLVAQEPGNQPVIAGTHDKALLVQQIQFLGLERFILPEGTMAGLR